MAKGRRKRLKVGGGADFEGHSSNKKAPQNFFPEMLALREGGEVILKVFPDIS
jgi:hypothetical protein